MPRVTIIRRMPLDTDYAYDELRIDADLDDALSAEEVTGIVTNWQNAAELLMPEPHNPPLLPPQQFMAPQPPTGAFAPQQPQPMPQPTFAPQPPQMPGFGNPALAAAESLASPCGDSKGQPLSACSDADLQYLTTYKKDGNIRNAAATIMAARNAGITSQHF